MILIIVPLGFVPGVWIIRGTLIEGSDPVLIVFGLACLAVAAEVAWALLWRSAIDVEVDGGEIRWMGYLRSGTAPLSDLRTVARPLYVWPALEFRFHGRRQFVLQPGRGVDRLLRRLSELNPSAVIDFPRRSPYLWLWPGRFEEM